jgi:cellulose synthase/poly-beta-1,6-N-acetylglucosamine synthase-like glycosyltransferase
LVPEGEPGTKPRACQYALQYTRGDYVVVYDAEDCPEPDQLRRALAAFRSGGDRLGCLQAQLNIYNSRQSWLTRQFTLEYTALFDAILPTLEWLRLPVPLGGTSNHFPGIA